MVTQLICSNLPPESPSRQKQHHQQQMNVMQPSPRRASTVVPSPRRMGVLVPPSPRPPPSPSLQQTMATSGAAAGLRRPSPLASRPVNGFTRNISGSGSSTTPSPSIIAIREKMRVDPPEDDSPMSYRARKGQENQRHTPSSNSMGWNPYGMDAFSQSADDYADDERSSFATADADASNIPNKVINIMSSPAASPEPSSEVTSQQSNPSSPFMELIYSASASTMATPKIFRIASDSEENKSTPIIRNSNSNGNGRATSPSSSQNSTLMSTTPRNNIHKQLHRHDHHQQQKHDGGGLRVPRVTAHHSNDRTSPSSLPSMLGEHDDVGEDVSALESPVVLQFQHSMEDTDINSLSQATDIYSYTTLTPSNNSGVFFRKGLRKANDRTPDELTSRAESCLSPSLTDIASSSAYFVSQADVDAAAEDQSTATSTVTSVNPTKDDDPCLHQHPQMEIVDHDDSIIPQPSEEAKGSYSNKKNNLRFFRTSKESPPSETQFQSLRVNHDSTAGWYLSQNNGEEQSAILDEDVDVSELSSQLESCRGDVQPIVAMNQPPRPPQERALPLQVSDHTSESNEGRKKESKCRNWTLILRLMIITLLTLAVVIPLVLVLLLHTRSNNSTETSNPNLGPTNGLPDDIPATEPPTMDQVAAPSVAPIDTGIQVPIWFPEQSTDIPVQVESPTEAPVETPTGSGNTFPPVLADIYGDLDVPFVPGVKEPTKAPLDSNPTIGSSLPPFTEVWTEENWNGLTVRFGPIWPNILRREGVVYPTIVDSMSNPSHSEILLSTIGDWEVSPHLSVSYFKEPLAASPSKIEECFPSPLQIRVCNGNYGTTATASRVTMRMYLAGRDIIGVVVLVNDDYGLTNLSSESALKRHLCHQLGHAFGVFHSSSGCMVEDISDDIFAQDQVLFPVQENFDEIETHYRPPVRRHLRSIQEK